MGNIPTIETLRCLKDMTKNLSILADDNKVFMDKSYKTIFMIKSIYRDVIAEHQKTMKPVVTVEETEQDEH